MRQLDTFSIDPMVRAVELVAGRLRRSTAALADDRVPFAVVGAHAVAWWVSQANLGGVRHTPNVDLLVDRDNLSAVAASLERAGFTRRDGPIGPVFVEDPAVRTRMGVQILFAGERVRPEGLTANPGVHESVPTPDYPVIRLEPLVRMKLAAFRDVDRTHLRDLIDVNVIDVTWPGRLPPVLGSRLQALLDTPGG